MVYLRYLLYYVPMEDIMDSIKFNKKNCKMIAHRGLSGVKFENTCESFYAAARRSYYGVEADIHVTSDKKFAILHDNDTGRIGNVKLVVAENTLEDLQKKVTLYDEDNNRLTGTIPSLADYINICKEYGKKAFLDLKNRYDPADIDKIIDEIIAANPDNVASYKAGKTNLMGWFVGQVMKASQGKANPGVVNQILSKKLV